MSAFAFSVTGQFDQLEFYSLRRKPDAAKSNELRFD
jgi:hypothetical protein